MRQTIIGALCGFSFISLAQAATPTTVIHAGHLISEPGQPVRDAQSIVIEGGKIVAIKDGYVDGDQVVELKDAWVMPGLIDMHSHISVAMDVNDDNPAGDFLAAYIGRPSQRLLQALVRGDRKSTRLNSSH